MDDRELIGTLREQTSNLAGLFALSMVMFDRLDEAEILRLAWSSVPAIGPFTAVDVQSPPLEKQLGELAGEDGPVTTPDGAWVWAYALRSMGGNAGHLVISADVRPSPDQRFLLKTLAQQAGAALHSARLNHRERAAAAQLSDLNAQLETVNQQLRTAVTDLERQQHIHQMLNAVAASGAGEGGIAETLHELTGLDVAVEDRFGHLRAWAGPTRPRPYPRATARERTELQAELKRHRRPVRHRDRVIAMAQPREEILGLLVLVDPEHRVGAGELFALEHAAIVLSTELAHQRGLAETELRLRADLLDDLLTGTDDESAVLRATALGHDLRLPQQVLVLSWPGLENEESFARAVAYVAKDVVESGVLLARRAGMLVLIASRSEDGPTTPQWRQLHDRVAKAVRSGAGAIGVGGPCTRPSQLPRSYAEAQRALQLRQGSGHPHGVTAFDELGIYRLLGADSARQEVSGFIREWLGELIDYDEAHGTDLVLTLWQYHESGGNYDATATALVIHRSTLRYRLTRIRELSGHDLRDVDTRLNLHIATRAWQLLHNAT
jgi:sugar diacid utilization regulator